VGKLSGRREALYTGATAIASFALYCPNSTCCVTTRTTCRDVTCDVTSVSRLPRRACSNMANDEETVVLACESLVFCALDLHQSHEQLLKKVRWTCPPKSTL